MTHPTPPLFDESDAAEAAWWFGAMTRRDGRRPIRALRILTEATK